MAGAYSGTAPGRAEHAPAMCSGCSGSGGAHQSGPGDGWATEDEPPREPPTLGDIFSRLEGLPEPRGPDMMAASAFGRRSADGAPARPSELESGPLCARCGNLAPRDAMPNPGNLPAPLGDDAAPGTRRGGRFFARWSKPPARSVPGRDPIALIREGLCTRDSLWT